MESPHRVSRLAVALDTDNRQRFSQLCEVLGSRVEVLKVGLEAYIQWGAAAVTEAKATGAKVFLDLKLHDIPNTVKGAVGACRRLGVDYLTVHAGGGPAMLTAAVDAAGDELKILAVTVLTSLDAGELEALGLPGSSQERVLNWARLAADAGCSGAVCSALEVRALRARQPAPFELVTPGIRLGQVEGDDQARVATPASALADGASLLVVGRPLTQAQDPELELGRWERELRQ